MPGDSSAGAYATGLLGEHLKAIVSLQSAVLKDQDSEPLHQLRVRFRRLGTLLLQFGPALQLPDRVTEQNLAKTGRRLGLVRDLDVLTGHLQHQLGLSQPAEELSRMKPVLKTLVRSRKLAFAEMVEELRSRRYLRLLAKLQAWLRQPTWTALGEEDARDWLVEWKTPVLAGLLSQPGWRAGDPDRDRACLHDLRKKIKRARYGLANLKELAGDSLGVWLERFKAQQDILGGLNDLQVLEQAIEEQLVGDLTQALPQLSLRLKQQKRLHWQQWQGQASSMVGEPGRRELHALLCRGWICPNPPPKAGNA
ncbi:MAG: CHAD domain-containing protein [Synechococcus sp. ELA619]